MAGDQLPELDPEVERFALLSCARHALNAMSTDQMRAAVDQIAGPGTAEAALDRRRRDARDAIAWLDNQRTEALRHDPFLAAKVETMEQKKDRG
jgi:hypothetical protein